MKNFLLITALIFGFVSCQNDGHIGSLFGTWGLMSMTVDGVAPEEFDPSLTTWSFQNNIIRIVLNSENHGWADRTGTWEKESTGGKRYLNLNFTHGEDGIEHGTGNYRAPEWLGFPENKIIPLEFVKDSSREMILSWTSDEGHVHIYTLRKTW